jgi:hypothetical protein
MCSSLLSAVVVPAVFFCFSTVQLAECVLIMRRKQNWVVGKFLERSAFNIDAIPIITATESHRKLLFNSKLTFGTDNRVTGTIPVKTCSP